MPGQSFIDGCRSWLLVAALALSSLATAHSVGKVPPAFHAYCQSLLLKFRELNPGREPRTPLHELIDALVEVETENTHVTTQYRKHMSQLSLARSELNRMLKMSDLEAGERETLLRAKAEIMARMEAATLHQLAVTRDFETRKEVLNAQIAELTGEPMASLQARLNHFYIQESHE